ncbi:uncharacterized protein [Mytilus edulis]|uniref:uncharacterized protein n=1 Tax=Mytilus edulis TaxID=6550 RepID=UPI0039EEA114
MGEILLCGDFNARIGSENDFIVNDDSKFTPIFDTYPTDKNIMTRKSRDQKIDQRGKEVLDFCISKQIRILNGRVLGDTFGNFTCYTPNGASVVDYVAVSEEILENVLYFKVSRFIPTLSDCHCKLEWELSAKYCVPGENDIPIQLKNMTPNYIWTDCSAIKFQETLSSDTLQNYILEFNNSTIQFTQTSVDEASSKLSNIFLSAANLSLKRPLKKHTNKQKNKKWFDASLQQARTNLLNYGKIYSRFPYDPIIKNHFYKLNREYSKLRKYKYKQYKQSLISQLDSLHEENPKLYWNLINELQEKNETKKKCGVQPSTLISHFQKLSQLKGEFQSRYTELCEKLKQLENSKCFNELDSVITESEISKAISHLKCNKSSGLDNISNNMIKNGQTFLLKSFQQMFNTCLSSGIYPTSWAEGYITPIFKSNDTSDPNNYRGITITSAIGKLFNRILSLRLDKFLQEHNIIHDSQIGFTRKARTADHMFILNCLINKYCNSKEGRLFACFVDFQKAFDTVIHTGIKIKLLDIGAGSYFYNIIKSMYEISKSCVKIQNQVSDFFPLDIGVKQGDNLSPNLFKIFINDLPRYLSDTRDPVNVNDKDLHCLMYADDIVLLSTSAEGLREKLGMLDKFCKDWCLNVNTNKTKVLIFNKAGRHVKQIFTFQNINLECVSKYKYLGLYLSSSGSFSYAQNELYKKSLKAHFKLRKDLLSLNPDVKTSIHVFDHTVKPILLYGSEIWGMFNSLSSKCKKEDISFEKLYSGLPCEKLHIKFCKFILGVHKKTTNAAVLSELGRFPIYFNIIKGMLLYWYRLENLGRKETFTHILHAYGPQGIAPWCQLPLGNHNAFLFAADTG